MYQQGHIYSFVYVSIFAMDEIIISNPPVTDGIINISPIVNDGEGLTNYDTKMRLWRQSLILTVKLYIVNKTC